MPMPITWRKPSLARRAIEGMFNTKIDAVRGEWNSGSGHLDRVKFLLDVLSNVDEHLIFTLSPEDGLEWRRNLAAIQAAVRRWQSGGEGRLTFDHAVAMHRLLSKCPDEIVPKAERDLPFIADLKLRSNIARDIDSLDTLVRDDEWKAATVIGGSVVEALLLDRLLDSANLSRAQAVEAAHITKGEKRWSPSKPVEEWHLWKMIAVAQELNLIDETVMHVCEGARDFRNLIHPSKERAEAPCDEGTALTAVAAVKNLVATFNGSR